MPGLTGTDGNGNRLFGVVDYQVWRSHFGIGFSLSATAPASDVAFARIATPARADPTLTHNLGPSVRPAIAEADDDLLLLAIDLSSVDAEQADDSDGAAAAKDPIVEIAFAALAATLTNFEQKKPDRHPRTTRSAASACRAGCHAHACVGMRLTRGEPLPSHTCPRKRGAWHPAIKAEGISNFKLAGHWCTRFCDFCGAELKKHYGEDGGLLRDDEYVRELRAT
ncbi:hypothetical protein [Pirellulimonas nuda]|uniref:hypothetical protein n=1 Tax=Pirellulimonas nuda TaxID=2528009 RepID=UPI0011AAEAE3|nr:hypothetical protein [Pirellulimonas nuda]